MPNTKEKKNQNAVTQRLKICAMFFHPDVWKVRAQTRFGGTSWEIIVALVYQSNKKKKKKKRLIEMWNEVKTTLIFPFPR